MVFFNIDSVIFQQRFRQFSDSGTTVGEYVVLPTIQKPFILCPPFILVVLFDCFSLYFIHLLLIIERKKSTFQQKRETVFLRMDKTAELPPIVYCLHPVKTLSGPFHTISGSKRAPAISKIFQSLIYSIYILTQASGLELSVCLKIVDTCSPSITGHQRPNSDVHSISVKNK